MQLKSNPNNIFVIFRMIILSALCITAAFQITSPAQTPSASPVLRLETGTHTATIRHVGVDAAGRFLVTASDDKTARVWDLQTGKTRRVLRIPISGGNAGKLSGIAISPNGKTVIVGGFTTDDAGKSFSIFIFDRENGSVIKRIGDLPGGVAHLTFSPDGQYFAVALIMGGLLVYDTKNFQLAGQDKDYTFSVFFSDFSPDSRSLATVSNDGFLRLYTLENNSLKLSTKVQSTEGKIPYSIKFSPDGSRLAVGFANAPTINVLSAKDLSLAFTPDPTGMLYGGLGCVSWSSDGNILYAAGVYRNSNGNQIRIWKDGGRGKPEDVTVADETIFDLQPLKTGGVVFSTAEPSWGVVETSGKLTKYITPVIANYKGMISSFLISGDGNEITFSYTTLGKTPAHLSINNRLLKMGEENNQELSAPLLTGINVTDWFNNPEPKLNGNRIFLDLYEMSRCLAVTPGKTKFLLGTDSWLRMYDLTGVQLWQSSIPAVAWQVNISGDGRLAVAAFADGTIRWYRVADGQELLAFFPHKDQKRWVLWTPAGYYDASPDAEDLIGWHVNNGRDAAADFFPAGLFRNQFYRPDIISKILYTADEAKAAQLANEEAGRKQQTADVAKQLPPVVEILNPANGAEVSSAAVKIRYNIKISNGEPVTNVKILVDGRPQYDARDLSIEKGNGGSNEVTVTIPEKDSEIAVIAENRFAPSVPAIVKLKWKGKTQIAADEFVVKPKLYILAIGVSKYQNADYNLGYAAKDAKDFAAVMQKQSGGLYREVVVKTLTDQDATRDNIVDGLDWIRLQTTAKDVAMIFMAGHGTNDTLNRYYFLPFNFNADRLASTGVTFGDIKNTVEAIAGKAVFFVDTCHSGNAMGTAKTRGLPDINGFVNELSSAENGAVVFTASTGRQVSLEDPAWNNGAFTKALVEGLSGKAEIPGKGKITINSLDLYISERVKQLTGGQQTPTTAKPSTVPDFPVAAKF